MTLDNETIKKIIEGDTKLMVAEAEKLGNCWGKELKKGERLTSAQIRNIFASVKKMEMQGFNEKEFLLLKPKLAYAAARREAKQGTKELKDVLTQAIEAVGSSKEMFKNFCDFFEAILAYHKAAEKGGEKE